MAFTKVWIHAVWGTKNREPLLSKDVRSILFQHIRDNAKKKSIYLDFINGYHDHIHCLFTLNADVSLSKTIQLIKGEASYWANKENLTKTKLSWADEYFAVSVSESMIEKVRIYIRNQEEHHQKKTFAQECDEFITKYGFSKQHAVPNISQG
jgi:putative transposase